MIKTTKKHHPSPTSKSPLIALVGNKVDLIPQSQLESIKKSESELFDTKKSFFGKIQSLLPEKSISSKSYYSCITNQKDDLQKSLVQLLKDYREREKKFNTTGIFGNRTKKIDIKKSNDFPLVKQALELYSKTYLNLNK